jgi:hypothetical protein
LETLRKRVRAPRSNGSRPRDAGAMAVPATIGWMPQTILAARFPEIGKLGRALEPEIRELEAGLDRREAGGGDTACLRQLLRELRWRLEYTADAGNIRTTFARIRALAALPGSPDASTPDAEGGYGPCTEPWFLKLDASVDRLLQADFDDHGKPPHFLDRINDPGRLKDYLESLLVSYPALDGIDRRKELNFTTAGLVRLILWRRPRNYPWDARLDAVVHRFVADWQDATTGFFGADYVVDGERLRTVDLSLTFHMARYLEGAIGYWPQLIDTLIAIRDCRYPNGWLDEVGLTSHNNYDVAMLFQLGWPHLRSEQQRHGEQELGRLLDWCLTTAIAPSGDIAARAIAESLPESYYFTIAFLDTVGYFDPAKRFWTARDFPGAAALAARLLGRLETLPQGDPMVRMARDRLRRSASAASRLEGH